MRMMSIEYGRSEEGDSKGVGQSPSSLLDATSLARTVHSSMPPGSGSGNAPPPARL